MTRWKRRTLLISWGGALVLALVCFGVFAQGLMRDYYTGDAVIRFDPTRAAEWRSASFRVRGEGTYRLYIASVNHDPDPVGRLFRGRLEVEVRDPDGEPVLKRTYGAGTTGHRVPDNYGDSALASLRLQGWPLRAWHLRLRVLEGDSEFLTGRTELRLRRQRDDPGMGGLVNYAMIVPGGIALLIALVLSLPLARTGTRWPLIATAAAGLALLVLL